MDKTESLSGTDAQTADESPRHSRPSFSDFSLPGFRIGAVLGRGGMGIVYEAEQVEPKRRVAIKVLHLHSPNALLRFRTEAQVMARLDHPGIARVYQSGDSAGLPYMVIEFVDGVPFDEHAKKQHLRGRLELFLQLCEAVHHAHVKGVVHRDLKPANIMVRPPGRVVVLDFGIARLEDDDLGATTQAGEMLGTPIYMCPEQASLRADAVDARSDLYTLGVILYELITETMPYKVRGSTLANVQKAIVESEPTPLRDHVFDIAPDLQAIVSKTLEKNPDRRYQSVALLGEDLRRYLGGMAVSVRNAGPLERFAKFVRRRPYVTAGVIGSMFALGIFGAVVTKLWLEARAAHHAEEQAHARAEQAHERAETSRGELEGRNNQLTLRQARAALRRDPTEAIAWLTTLTERDIDPGIAWAIVDEAIARGVAHDVVRAHTDQVHRVEPLPGGTGFVTAGYDSRAIVWTGTPATPRATIRATKGRVHAARPSPDGTLIAIGGDDGELLAASADGARTTELVGHAGSVQDVAWSPDGAWLASGDDKGNIYVWPRGAAPGKRLVTAKQGTAGIAFSSDSKQLVAGDLGGSLWVFDLAAGTQRTTTLAGELAGSWSDGTRVLTVDATGVVREHSIELAVLRLQHTTTTGMSTKKAVISSDGRWAVLGGVGGGLVRVQGPSVERITAFRAQVRSIAISPDGRWIAAGTDDGSLEVRDTTSDRVVSLRGHRGRVRHVSFTLDSRALMSSDSDGVVRVWALNALANPILSANGLSLNTLAASDDGSQVAAVDAAGTIWRWTLASANRLAVGTAEGRITQLAVRDNVVITATAEGDVRWFGAASAQHRVDGIVRALAVTRDRVAVATSKGAIALFTLDGKALPALPGHPGGTDGLAFSTDGRWLASAGQDRVLRVWLRADDDTYRSTILDGKLESDTRFLRFSPASDVLAAAGNDGKVHTWTFQGAAVSMATHHIAAIHTGAITALAFDDSGKTLASGGRDASVTRTTLGSGVQATAKLANAPLALVFDGANDIHAITYTGAEERWTPGKDPVIEVELGLVGGLSLRAGRWVLGFEDGTLLVTSRSTRPLAELRPLLERTTTLRR